MRLVTPGQRNYGAAVGAQIGADRGIAARAADIDGHYPVPPSGRVSNTSPNTLVPGQVNAAPIQCYCATAAYHNAVRGVA